MIRVENMDTGDSYLPYDVVAVNLQRLVPNPNSEDPSEPWIWQEYIEYASWRLPFNPAPAIKDENTVGYHVEVILQPADRPADWRDDPLWQNYRIGDLTSSSKYTDAWAWDPSYYTMFIEGSREVVNDVLANMSYMQDPAWDYTLVGGFYVTFLVREMGTGPERNESHELLVIALNERIFSILRGDNGTNPEKITISEADLVKAEPGIPSVSFKVNSTPKRFTDRHAQVRNPFYLQGPGPRKLCAQNRSWDKLAQFNLQPLAFKDLKTPDNFKPQPAWLVPLGGKLSLHTSTEERRAVFDHTTGQPHPAFGGDGAIYPKIPLYSLLGEGPPVISESEKVFNDNLTKVGQASFISTEMSNSGKYLLAGAPLSHKRGYGSMIDLMKRVIVLGDGECIMKPGITSLSQVYLAHSILRTVINGTKNGVSLTEFYKCSSLYFTPEFRKPFQALFSIGPLGRSVIREYRTPGILLNTAGRVMSFGYRPDRLVANGIRPIPRITDRWNLMGITYLSRICNVSLSTPEGGFTFGRISGGVSHVKAVKFTGRING